LIDARAEEVTQMSGIAIFQQRVSVDLVVNVVGEFKL
jgi:hypothetical protein